MNGSVNQKSAGKAQIDVVARRTRIYLRVSLVSNLAWEIPAAALYSIWSAAFAIARTTALAARISLRRALSEDAV